MKESDQYKPIANCLKEQLGCLKTWHVGIKPGIRLNVLQPNNRIPDVVGARMLEGGDWRTHIVEAKRTNSGHAVQQAIGQLNAVKKWADRLYLSIEAKSWRDFSSKDK